MARISSSPTRWNGRKGLVRNWWQVLIVLACTASLCGIHLGADRRRGPGVQPKRSAVLAAEGAHPGVASLSDLIRLLGDGPIQVCQAKRGSRVIDENLAVEAARAATGWPADQGAWFARVTDREYLSSLVKHRPCWIVRLHTHVRLPDTHAHLGPAPFYAVVDATDGILLEVFSAPVAPWWHRVGVKNEAAMRELEGAGEQAALPAGAPPLPLSAVVGKSAPFASLDRAQQLIACYMLLTSGSYCWVPGQHVGPDHREWERVPAWYISSEGIHQIFDGTLATLPPAGVRGADVERFMEHAREGMPRDEEENEAVSAVSGNRISVCDYR